MRHPVLWTKFVEALWCKRDKLPKATRLDGWLTFDLYLPRRVLEHRKCCASSLVFVRSSNSSWSSEFSCLKLNASSQGACLLVSNVSILGCCGICRETQYTLPVRQPWVLTCLAAVSTRMQVSDSISVAKCELESVRQKWGGTSCRHSPHETVSSICVMQV